MSSRLDTILSATLVAAAVTIAVALVHREFFRRTPVGLTAAEGKPRRVKNLQELSAIAIPVTGDSAAPAQIIEFTDFQCPFCRDFHERLRDYQRRFPGKVALNLVHFPLPGHRSARSAAQAAECARADARLAEMADLLYAKQDSFGQKSWTSFALEAHVRDTVRFAQCMSDSSSARLVDAGIAAGNRLGVHGTPTIVLNGWQLARPPSVDSLSQLVTALGKR